MLNSTDQKREDSEPILKNFLFLEATSHCKRNQWFMYLTKIILVRRICTLGCWRGTKLLLWVSIYCYFIISFYEQKWFHVFLQELGILYFKEAGIYTYPYAYIIGILTLTVQNSALVPRLSALPRSSSS